MTQATPLNIPSELATLILTRESLDISEFEVFRMAYEEWYGGKPTLSHLEKQFDGYLLSGEIPFYVRHYCRQFVENRPDCVRTTQENERRGRLAERLATALLIAFVAAALILN